MPPAIPVSLLERLFRRRFERRNLALAFLMGGALLLGSFEWILTRRVQSAVAIPVVAVALLSVVFQRSDAKASLVRLNEAVPEGTDSDWSVIQLTLFWDGLPYGDDTGYGYFRDGLLVFRGVRTSFQLASIDVVARPDLYFDPALMNSPHGQSPYGAKLVEAWQFDLKEPSKVSVQMKKRPGIESMFDYKLRAWLDNPTPAREASVLPPLIPMPEDDPDSA